MRSLPQLIAQVSVPVHDEAGDAQDREAHAQQGPKNFDGQAPHRAEVQSEHRAENPVSLSYVVAIMPDSQDAGSGGVRRELRQRWRQHPAHRKDCVDGRFQRLVPGKIDA